MRLSDCQDINNTNHIDSDVKLYMKLLSMERNSQNWITNSIVILKI